MEKLILGKEIFDCIRNYSSLNQEDVICNDIIYSILERALLNQQLIDHDHNAIETIVHLLLW